MPRPSRPFPRVGAPARIGHFGGEWEPAVVRAIDDEGRTLLVQSEGGEELEFTLSRATARFVAGAGNGGVRLELL